MGLKKSNESKTEAGAKIEYIVKVLRAIKKKAYSGLTCREYEAICGVIFLMELLSEKEGRKNDV